MPLPTQIPTRPRALSGAGTLVTGGYVHDQAETNSELEGSSWYGSPSLSGIADQMLKDSHVRMSLEYVTGPLRAASWVFEPGGDLDADKEAAEFCNHVFFERLSWDRFLRECLTYKQAGFSMFELTDDVVKIQKSKFPNHPGDGLAVSYTGLHHRPAWTTHRWIQSKQNPTQIEAWEQYILPSDGEQGGIRTIPASRLLRFTENQSGAVFHGFSTLRSAYGPWKVKTVLAVVEAMSHERQHMGTPTIRLPETANDDDIDAAAQILGAMRSNEKGFLVLPHGFDFKWEIPAGEGTPIHATIERMNRDIAQNVGAGFMLLGLQGGSGSYALATSQQGQFEIGLETDARFIASTINQGADGWSPVQRLVQMNYGEQVAVPKLTVRNTPTKDWTKVLPVVHNLSVSGLVTPDDSTEAFIRDVLRLPQQDKSTARTSNGEAETMEEEGEE